MSNLIETAAIFAFERKGLRHRQGSEIPVDSITSWSNRPRQPVDFQQKIFAQRAADAPVAHLHQCLFRPRKIGAAIPDKRRIDVDVGHVVDDHRDATTLTVMEDVIKQGGLARAEEAREHGDRKLGWKHGDLVCPQGILPNAGDLLMQHCCKQILNATIVAFQAKSSKPQSDECGNTNSAVESGPACSDRNRHAGPAASFYLRCLNATWADVPYCQAICHSIVARNAKTEASDVNCMGKKACSMDPPVIDHVSEVGNSILQRRIIGLMAAGHRLVTVRSPITRHVVHVAVMTPENASIIDRIHSGEPSGSSTQARSFQIPATSIQQMSCCCRELQIEIDLASSRNAPCPMVTLNARRSPPWTYMAF
jgi:hypothetical protein